MSKLTMKQMFRLMYRYARAQHRETPSWPAFDLAEDAVESLIHIFGYDRTDIDDMLKVSTAVLWAVHWRFMKPMHASKLWQSDRRVSWNLDGKGMVMPEAPRLP